jgi:hypothetical protein
LLCLAAASTFFSSPRLHRLMSPTRNSLRSPPRGGGPYPSPTRSGPMDLFGNSQNDYSQNRPQPFGSSSRYNTQHGHSFSGSYGGPGTPSADPRYNTRMPALSSTVTIDHLCNTYKIGTSGRNSAHEYCQVCGCLLPITATDLVPAEL